MRVLTWLCNVPPSTHIYTSTVYLCKSSIKLDVASTPFAYEVKCSFPQNHLHLPCIFSNCQPHQINTLHGVLGVYFNFNIFPHTLLSLWSCEPESMKIRSCTVLFPVFDCEYYFVDTGLRSHMKLSQNKVYLWWLYFILFNVICLTVLL